MKKEIYIYLLLVGAIGCSIYLETSKLLKQTDLGVENKWELVNNHIFNHDMTVNAEVTPEVSQKPHQTKDNVMLEILLSAEDSSKVVIDLAGNWFDAKKLKLHLPFAISDAFRYKFVICTNFQNCSSLQLPEISLFELITDRFLTSHQQQAS